MSYKMSIGLEASGVPAKLEQWLLGSLPMDFFVRLRKVRGIRVLNVTITGTTLSDLKAKRQALAKVVRRGGFRGMVVKDIRPKNV